MRVERTCLINTISFPCSSRKPRSSQGVFFGFSFGGPAKVQKKEKKGCPVLRVDWDHHIWKIGRGKQDPPQRFWAQTHEHQKRRHKHTHAHTWCTPVLEILLVIILGLYIYKYNIIYVYISRSICSPKGRTRNYKSCRCVHLSNLQHFFNSSRMSKLVTAYWQADAVGINPYTNPCSTY